jgi:hypothetical protein
MAAGATSLVAVLRDARKRRAPLDEADEWCRYDSNLGNAVLGLEQRFQGDLFVSGL